MISRRCLVILYGDNSRPNDSVCRFSSECGIGLVENLKVLVIPCTAVVLKLLYVVIYEVAERLTGSKTFCGNYNTVSCFIWVQIDVYPNWS